MRWIAWGIARMSGSFRSLRSGSAPGAGRHRCWAPGWAPSGWPKRTTAALRSPPPWLRRPQSPQELVGGDDDVVGMPGVESADPLRQGDAVEVAGAQRRRGRRAVRVGAGEPDLPAVPVAQGDAAGAGPPCGGAVRAAVEGQPLGYSDGDQAAALELLGARLDREVGAGSVEDLGGDVLGGGVRPGEGLRSPGLVAQSQDDEGLAVGVGEADRRVEQDLQAMGLGVAARVRRPRGVLLEVEVRALLTVRRLTGGDGAQGPLNDVVHGVIIKLLKQLVKNSSAPPGPPGHCRP